MTYQEKMAELLRQRNQVKTLADYVTAKEQSVSKKESMIRQGFVSVESPRDLERNLAKSMGPLAPGNIGDIDKVIWPYWFSTEFPTTPISQNQSATKQISVTQEAAFIFMSFTKTVYQTNVLPWTYLDPNVDGLLGQAPGLSFFLRDGSSSRQFLNQPAAMGNYGNPRFPTKLPRPIMLLPNQIMQVTFTNTHATNIYNPSLTMFGYRMRIEDAQNFLSLVNG